MNRARDAYMDYLGNPHDQEKRLIAEARIQDLAEFFGLDYDAALDRLVGNK